MLNWPAGANATGQFEFTVTTDTANQLFENNLAGTAETNNSSKVSVLSAADLVVGNLVSDKTSPVTGDLITLSWNDINNGNTAINAGWYDHIVVVNKTTGATLVNQQLRFDPASGSLVQAGASAARSFSFLLADGTAGVGNLQITVTTDQNTSGVGSLVEANASGTAESRT